jgi:hypothetical protein
MPDTNDKTPHTWTVLDQEQTVGQLPDRSYGPIVRITFKTEAGIVRSVNIPVADYSVDQARTVIDAAASETDAVQNL